MWRYQSYDEGRTDSGKTSSGWNPAFNLYLYINFFAILVSQVRCYCNLYLLSFIVTMYLTKFLYEQYSKLHYIEGHYFIVFFVSIIGCHFILCYINSFLYLQIQLYDTFSLSLSIMCNGYCAIELRI